MKKFTVIIPTRGDKPYFLARLLKSLEKQTYPKKNFEIIVVDNGCKDICR